MPPADVELGGTAEQLAVGFSHTCALMVGGAVRCWGGNSDGQLGLGHTASVGGAGGQMPPADTNVGGAVSHISAGRQHTCAVLALNGTVRCWGSNTYGEAGDASLYANGTGTKIGDEAHEMPPHDLDLGDGRADVVSAGGQHTCVLFVDQTIKCFGRGNRGQLGNYATTGIGTEHADWPPPTVDTLRLAVFSVLASEDKTCVTTQGNLENEGGQLLRGERELHCWGHGMWQQLGDGNSEWDPIVGLNYPSRFYYMHMDQHEVDVGGVTVVEMGAGHAHVCAVLSPSHEVKCWGHNDYGQIGMGAEVEYWGSAEQLPAPSVQLNGQALGGSLRTGSQPVRCSAPLRHHSTLEEHPALCTVDFDRRIKRAERLAA
eukprot:gene2294-3015_t